MSETKLVIYQANPQTGEYVGPTFADPDPLEPENWLIPARAFIDEPKPGFAVVHKPNTEQVWSLVPDCRGTVYRIANGEAVSWNSFGPLPDEFTSEIYPGPYYVWKDGSWELDKAAQVEAQAAKALADRDELLIDAATRIAPLQDAVDLGEATPEEEAELTAWKRYRVALNRIQQQPNFPIGIEWPLSPTITPKPAA
jgi:hypothetical protein